MNGYVLDGCTLLNLYCAWGGIGNLKAFPATFHIGTAVGSEIHYVREYEAQGYISNRKLSTTDLAQQYPLQQLSLTSRELDLMVHLSRWLDDGEAQGLAIAVSRDLCFCTDDGAVHRLIVAQGLHGRLISTPELLQAWAGEDPGRLASLPSAVRRTTKLGKFTPNRSSPHLSWWRQMLGELPD